MYTVKLSSHYWRKSKDGVFSRLKILNQLPSNNNEWGNYKFEINNDCDECDFWLIYDSLEKPEKVKVPKEHVILITTEEVSGKPYLKSYQNQFTKIITSRDDINGDHVIKTYYCNLWRILKTYNELKFGDVPVKTKQLSIVSSDLVRKPGQMQRYALINKLIGHFKDKVDVFGRGFNPIEDKYEALATYKYSVAIENSAITNYWSEKIVDCYLSETLPLYFGCPNIEDFFDPKSLVKIDLHDYKKTIQIIEQLIEEDYYEKAYPKIVESKHKILDELQFFPWVTKLLDENFNQTISFQKSGVKLLPSDDFLIRAELSSTLKKASSLMSEILKRKKNALKV